MGEPTARATSWNLPSCLRLGTSVLVFALSACGSSEPPASAPVTPKPPMTMTAPVTAPPASGMATAPPAGGGQAPAVPVADPKPMAAPSMGAVAGGAAPAGVAGAGATPTAGDPTAGQTPAPTSGCDRACLILVLDGYLDALAKGDPSTLKQAASLKYTENGATREIGQGGLWQSASGVAEGTRNDFADPVEGQVGSQFALESGSIVAIRMKVVEGELTEVEAVSTSGSAEPDPIFNMPIDPAKRMSREDLLAMAQAYEKLLEGGSYTMSGAKFHDDMVRRENGNQTADAASLRMREQAGRGEIPSRYPVIDEEYGKVFGVYEFKDNGFVPQELFKIMEGEIRLLDVLISVQGGESGWEPEG
jgi:hypothetical protein